MVYQRWRESGKRPIIEPIAIQGVSENVIVLKVPAKTVRQKYSLNSGRRL
jgi:hypothetical protein